MIIRKPYAFLIKNFKKIHFLLFIALVYVGYTSNRLLTFFNQYEKTKQAIFSGNLSDAYITIIMFIVGLFIIAIAVFIYILMKQKDKPKGLYISMIVYYFLLLVLFMVDSSYLNTIQAEGLGPQTVRLIRDINFISVIIQVFFGLLIIVRTVGFDIKKFGFGEDIENLQIDVTDNEEFELTSGINTEEVGRKYRKQIREFKYFYLENKKIIISIISIIIILIVGIYLFQTQVLNKIFNQSDTVNLNNLNFKVTNVYSTKLNYKGVNVSEKGYTFVILDLNLNNKDIQDRTLKMDNLKVVIGNNIYATDITKYDYFRDIGIGYIDQRILKNTIKNYIAVFKVKDEDLNKEMTLRYADQVSFSNGGLNTKYTKIRISPMSLDTVTDFVKAELKKEVYYGLSLLKETTLKINSIEFNNKFKYTNNNLDNYIVEPLTTDTILKISYDFKLDNSIKYIQTFEDFLKKFGSITYKSVGRTYTAAYTILTPNNYVGSDSYLSVNKKVADSTSIELIMTIRNKRYTYVLK